MKNKISVLLTICILILSACNSEDSRIKEIVWEQLTTGQQSEVVGGWKSGIVEELIVEKSSSYYVTDDSLLGKEVYVVTFKSENVQLIGNIKVLVDKESLEIVGGFLRM